MFIYASFQVIGYSNIQCPIPLTCQNIYKIFTKHKPFSSQVEDKSGFPLKACGNDKPYIFMSTYLFCWFNRPRLNQNVSVQATSPEPAQTLKYPYNSQKNLFRYHKVFLLYLFSAFRAYYPGKGGFGLYLHHPGNGIERLF